MDLSPLLFPLLKSNVFVVFHSKFHGQCLLLWQKRGDLMIKRVV